MKAPDLKVVAAGVVKAGAPRLPTVLLVREVPLFEIEFSALEFIESTTLPPSDWAALALAHAIGTISPFDIDAYLGLGATVSEGLLRRLLSETLLEERSDEMIAAKSTAEESGLSRLLRRLSGTTTPRVAVVAPPSRATAARKVRESRASTFPVCRLSPHGAQALELGAIAHHRVRPARFIFLAEPLLFLGSVDEKRQRHTQYRRPQPLDPDRVPEAFRVLDTTFALPPEQRRVVCGIERSVQGFPGQLAGIKPGSQWEVRPAERGGKEKRAQQKATLILAAFAPDDDFDDLQWHVYLQERTGTRALTNVDAMALLPSGGHSLNSLVNTIESDPPLNHQIDLRDDGALELRFDSPHLLALIGEADRPDDTFLPAKMAEWEVGLRTHAMPTDIEAGRAVFFEFLRRQDAALRRDFDRTCADVATSLITYWGDSPGLPSVEEAAIQLWVQTELRAALCMRRLHRDLLTPYENEEPVQ